MCLHSNKRHSNLQERSQSSHKETQKKQKEQKQESCQYCCSHESQIRRICALVFPQRGSFLFAFAYHLPVVGTTVTLCVHFQPLISTVIGLPTTNGSFVMHLRAGVLRVKTLHEFISSCIPEGCPCHNQRHCQVFSQFFRACMR